ncbi:hypothetical protein FOA43_003558 [Brettanomyces nanus]|uniref:Zn(2)-C6 fungal-type domain-containing protein n=1 Tax=Eeniella nana TaxID=13502 RepID=A0A875S8E2_EENNA|nr:uncharacterized protein FOA43_003558 [Brettanomyces nanus]QPG76172.1 hypothetical protein FOA43_003558 [Brettanomyces nanus]
MMPISCMECRRRKIKCNKMVPCNQCTVKDRHCEYPPKFRSIKVEQLVMDDVAVAPLGDDKALLDGSVPLPNGLLTAPSSNSSSSSDSPHGITRPRELISMEESNSMFGSNGIKRPKIEETSTVLQLEGLHNLGQLTPESTVPLIQKLNKENEGLKLKIRDLRLKNKRQRTKLKKIISSQIDCDDSSDDDIDDDIEDDGKPEQHDNFEKVVKPSSIYYGPNSTRYMISSSMTKDEISEFDDFIKVKRQIKQKRNLPVLVHPKANSAKAKQIAKKENVEAIIALLKKFFHLKVHYVNFISPIPLLELFAHYDSITEWNKNDDDKLLLSIIIIIVTLRSLPANDPLLYKYGISYEKNRESLYKQYKNLKRGIQIETTTSLRAYVLECEDLFFNDQIEKSWSLLFRLVSSAYSLGLHVYDESIVKTLKAEQHEKSGDVIKKNPKTSLWLIINFISATLCSVLGRPNPVTFNFQPLLKNYEIRLNYKIALADLVKKSTNILIDSYKIPIDLDTVLDIDESFVNEVLIYEKILIDTRIMRNMRSRDITKPSFITLPVIDKSLGGNPANDLHDHDSGADDADDKDHHNHHHHFHRSHGKEADRDAETGTKRAISSADVGVQSNWLGKKSNSVSQMDLSKLLVDCPLDIRFTILRPCPLQNEEEPWCLILEDADTLCDLIMLYGNRAKFHQHFMSKYTKSLESCLDSILKVLEHTQDLVELMLKKFAEASFQRVYPFFYVFLYQTFVVTYTLMHLGYAKLSAYYNEIGMIRQRLIKLFDTVGPKHWRPNVIRIIQYINDMCDNFFKTYLEKEQQIPKSTTLPPLPEGNKSMVVHPGTYKIQHERLQQEKERQLQNAIPNFSEGADSATSLRTPLSLNSMFQINSLANSPNAAGNGNMQPMPMFPDLLVHNVPDDIRNKLSRSIAISAPTVDAGATATGGPSSSGPSNETVVASQSGDGSSVVGVINAKPSGFLVSQPVQSYLNNNSASLSQISLSNYNMDYYNPVQQFFPPPAQQQQHQKAESEEQQEPVTHVTNSTPPTQTFTIDPLLGFDLNDPFFVQNPFNFNYASSPGNHNSVNAAPARSDAAEFVRNDSVTTVTTNSNELVERSSSDCSK